MTLLLRANSARSRGGQLVLEAGHDHMAMRHRFMGVADGGLGFRVDRLIFEHALKFLAQIIFAPVDRLDHGLVSAAQRHENILQPAMHGAGGGTELIGLAAQRTAARLEQIDRLGPFARQIAEEDLIFGRLHFVGAMFIALHAVDQGGDQVVQFADGMIARHLGLLFDQATTDRQRRLFNQAPDNRP